MYKFSERYAPRSRQQMAYISAPVGPTRKVIFKTKKVRTLQLYFYERSP